MRSPWSQLTKPSPKINPVGAVASSGHSRLPADPVASIEDDDDVVFPVARESEAGPRGWAVDWIQKVRRNGSGALSSAAPLPKALEGEDGEVRIYVGVEEVAQLLGDNVMSGNVQVATPKRGLEGRIGRDMKLGPEVQGHLTSEVLQCGSKMTIFLDDVVAVSCFEGSRLLTVHCFPRSRSFWMPACLGKGKRRKYDFSFLAASPEEAWMWIAGFAEQGCHVNIKPESLSPLERERVALGGDLRNPARGGYAHFDGEDANLDSSQVRLGGLGQARVGAPWPPIRTRARPSVAVFINPKSGRGKAARTFKKNVQPVLELAGFKLNVLETTGPRHAEKLAASLDLASCPDGIVCVGGDGIVNEVINGLYIRPDAAEAMAVPLGVIPAGSDNSLIWTVLGISDAASAAMAIVKGGTVPMDVLLLQWEASGTSQIGLNSAYFGFMSDVLELSGKYQKHVGPLKYLVAGFLKLLRVPVFNYDVQYLPLEEPLSGADSSVPSCRPDSANVDAPAGTDVSSAPADLAPGEHVGAASGVLGGGYGHALSWSALNLEMDLSTSLGREVAKSRMAATLRGLGQGHDHARSKQSPPASPGLGWEETVVSAVGCTSPSPRSRVRTKLKNNRLRGWVPLDGAVDVAEEVEEHGGAEGASHTRSMSDEVPEGSWGLDEEAGRVVEQAENGSVAKTCRSVSDLGGMTALVSESSAVPPGGTVNRKKGAGVVGGGKGSRRLPILPRMGTTLRPSRQSAETDGGQSAEEFGEKWVTKKGPFLAIMVCNHRCRSVQCMDSLNLAPQAEADDGLVDLILVKPLGHLQFLRFLIFLQFSRHVTLPKVEYIKCRAIRVIPGANQHRACGIDGELLPLDEPVLAGVLHKKCNIIGRPCSTIGRLR